MRIDTLRIRNFRKYSDATLSLHPQFTLLVGENGAGKTSVLDALAVSLGVWHRAAPGSGWRNILPEEVRIEPVQAGDRQVFEARLPSAVTATGTIGDWVGLTWTRMVKVGGARTTNAEAKDAEKAIESLVLPHESRPQTLPVLAYYGAGRAWLPSNKRPAAHPSLRKTRRVDAYYQCLDTRIRDKELNEWFLYEAAASNGSGSERPGLRAVKSAILKCIPGARSLTFDSSLKQIVLSVNGVDQPFYNLSAGQRMMLALVADIAIKAVILNSHLLGIGQAAAHDCTELMRLTPGVVLIDELDVHLHPNWQRRVAADLVGTFPAMQFICTSHSPQIIGELPPEQIRILSEESIATPDRSIGIDSSRILEELMGSRRRDELFDRELSDLFAAIDREDFASAREKLAPLESKLGSSDSEIVRARTLISLLENAG